VLRYYKQEDIFKIEFISKVTKLMPWALFFHFIFGVLMFSNKKILFSPEWTAYIGDNSSRYFSNSRVG
jgi:hypothetical protein